jgi:acyl-coenzyme A synthetase/AMP-(fatty) acid ligase
MHLIEMIYYWARAVPYRPAIVQSEMVTTYQGLADAIDSIGDRIDRLNLEKHAPVAVCLSNPSFMLATAFALLRAGYRTAPVNVPLYPHLAGADIHNLIYDTEGQVTSGGRNIRFDMSWLPERQQETVKRTYRRRPIENADCVFFTSGTTGLPKKVVQPAAALHRLLQYPFTCASGNEQKILVMPGLASGFGFNRVSEVLNVGKTACYAPSAEAALSLIHLFGVEVVVASVAQALVLAEMKRRHPSYRVDSLKNIIVGGGKLEPEGFARISAALCREVRTQYASTEAGIAAAAPFAAIADIPGAVGVVMPWAEMQIVDEAGAALGVGVEGLVRYRTPRLLENIQASGADAVPGVRDGWFYPGDIGSLTSEGVLCLTGRTSDVINRGGVKVSAMRIEEILKTLPGIKDAAACGVACASGLEELWVAIIASEPVDVEQIKTHLRDHGSVGIAPDEIFVLDELPRGELGKVQKYRLKEQLLGLKRVA